MSGNRYFDVLNSLKWSESDGIGYYPVKDMVYDSAYLEKYQAMARTQMGQNLTLHRTAIVHQHSELEDCVDIGVGSGQYMEWAGCMGFDINPEAVKILKKDGTYVNPYEQKIKNATFWDSLEHIPDIAKLLSNVSGFIFVSLPIFENLAHVLRSKHYRPDEHCWYFTKTGFEKFISAHGFDVIQYSNFESILGREDIGTFVCKRVRETDE